MGAALKRARRRSKQRQADVAAAIGVAPKTYEQWEQGYVSIRASYIPLIAKAIGQSPAELLAELSSAAEEPAENAPVNPATRPLPTVEASQEDSVPRPEAVEVTRSARLAETLRRMMTDLSLGPSAIEEALDLEPGTIDRILDQRGRIPSPPLLLSIAYALEADYLISEDEQRSNAFGVFVRLMAAAGHWNRNRLRHPQQYQRLVSKAISDGLHLKSISDSLKSDIDDLEREYESSVNELDQITFGGTFFPDELPTEALTTRAQELQERIEDLETDLESLKEDYEDALKDVANFIIERVTPIVHGQLELDLYPEETIGASGASRRADLEQRESDE